MQKINATAVLAALVAATVILAGIVQAQIQPDEVFIPADEAVISTETYTGALETVFEFSEAMPTGVTVSQAGRIFVNFPRWGDDVAFTVGEIRDRRLMAYPDLAFNQAAPDRPGEGLISVQSVVVDPVNRLWLLDTGSVEFGPVTPGGAKLVGVDLARDRIFQTIVLPPEVALPTTYLNDLRFDLRRGDAGLAFITDSSLSGPNAIIVVDLATGDSWRQLDGHPSVTANADFRPIVEGRPFLLRPPAEDPQPLLVGADGIAMGATGDRLYYCSLSGRHLYSVSLDALANRELAAEEVAATVVDLGEKGASDGLESDTRDRIYITDYEHNALRRRDPDGSIATLVHDPRVLWPDTLSLATDGHLYFTANQLHRQPGFQGGEDRRQKPYLLFRIPLEAEAQPVLLR
ncbi:MAG: L-dopachrome tautomerase-related protein [Cyanobacteria bacterium J06641_5]